MLWNFAYIEGVAESVSMILFMPASQEGGSAVKALLRTSQIISKVSEEDGRRFPSENLNPSVPKAPSWY